MNKQQQTSWLYLVFLQSRPQLLVLLLESPDMPVLLLDTQHQLGPGSVVSHLVEVLHVLLVLSHCVHLLQHLLRSVKFNIMYFSEEFKYLYFYQTW